MCFVVVVVVVVVVVAGATPSVVERGSKFSSPRVGIT